MRALTARHAPSLQDFANKCHIGNLVDKRFQGMAVGVGSSKIIGKVHQVVIINSRLRTGAPSGGSRVCLVRSCRRVRAPPNVSVQRTVCVLTH